MARINNENKGNEIIPRSLIFDNRLSDRARFVYCYMSAKPEGWDFVLAPMAAELNYSVDTLRKYLRELVDYGWITKGEQKKLDGAKFGSFEYTINNKPHRKFSDTEKTRVGKIPTQDNSSNINITPTDNNSTVNSPINKENNKNSADALSKNAQEQRLELNTEHDERERNFLEYMEKGYPRVQKMEDPLTYAQFLKLCERYERSAVMDILAKMNNSKDCKKKNYCAYQTALNWLAREYKTDAA